MKKLFIPLLLILSSAAFAHAPINQNQYNRIHNHSGFGGARVVKKTACAAQEFIDELQARKSDVGFVYTVDYIETDKSYALVNNYGQNVQIVYEVGTGPFPDHIYDGWGNAFLAFQEKQQSYFSPDPLLGPQPPILNNPYTDQTEMGRFYINLLSKPKETFNDRMTCVKFDRFETATMTQLYLDNEYIDSSINMTAIQTKYPRTAQMDSVMDPAARANIAVYDTQTTAVNVYPEQQGGAIVTLDDNFSTAVTTNGILSYIKENWVDGPVERTHADMMNAIIYATAPNTSTIYSYHVLNSGLKGCIVNCYDALKSLYETGVDSFNIRVLNKSAMSAYGNSPITQDYINKLVTEKDVVVVEAVGNSPLKVLSARKRELTDLQLTVGTITNGYIRSTYGPNITDIVVTNPGGMLPTVGNNLGFFVEKYYNTDTWDNRGQTSIATASVSGFVAWMRTVYPWLSATQVKEAICESATPIPLHAISNQENDHDNYKIGLVKCGLFNPMAAMDYAYTHYLDYPAKQFGYIYIRDDSTPITYWLNTTTNWSATTGHVGDTSLEACENYLDYLITLDVNHHNTYGTPLTSYSISSHTAATLRDDGVCNISVVNPTNGVTSINSKPIEARTTFPIRFISSSLEELVSKANDQEHSWLRGRKSASVHPDTDSLTWYMNLTDTYPEDGTSPDAKYNVGPYDWECLGGTFLGTFNNVRMCRGNVTVQN